MCLQKNSSYILWRQHLVTWSIMYNIMRASIIAIIWEFSLFFLLQCFPRSTLGLEANVSNAPIFVRVFRKKTKNFLSCALFRLWFNTNTLTHICKFLSLISVTLVAFVSFLYCIAILLLYFFFYFYTFSDHNTYSFTLQHSGEGNPQM